MRNMQKMHTPVAKPDINSILDGLLFLQQETSRLGLNEISALLKSTYIEIDVLHNKDNSLEIKSKDIYIATAMLKNIENNIKVIMKRFNIERNVS